MFYPLKTIENRVSSDGSLQYVFDIDPSKNYK